MVRHKNRYIVIEISETDKKEIEPLQLRPASLHFAITSKVQQLHGDFGVAAITAGFTAKYCNEKTRIALIRCRHGPHKLVSSTIPFITFIEKKRCKINTLYIGATIKNCFKFIQNYQQKKFDEYCGTLTTDDEKSTLKKEIMNLTPILNM